MTLRQLPGRTKPESKPRSKYGEAFVKFHNDNPNIYKVLEAGAFEWNAKRPGWPLGIDLLICYVRWELPVNIAEFVDFKINDKFSAYYARLLMHRNPELADLFECRKSEADEFLPENWSRLV